MGRNGREKNFVYKNNKVNITSKTELHNTLKIW
jgi:hypothetical protein